MSNPFRDPSLWIRTVAFSAAIFGISLGLCGLNVGVSAVFSSFLGGSGVAGNIPISSWASPLLAITGIVEIGGMVIGAAGIALSILAIVIQIFWRMATRKG